jgi:hypothetical protein
MTPSYPEQVEDQYEYKPGRKLCRGDFVRISQGPYWVSPINGRHHKMATTGRFLFHGFTIDKSGSEVIIVREQGREVPIVIKHSETAPIIDGMVRRPYKISKERLKCD